MKMNKVLATIAASALSLSALAAMSFSASAAEKTIAYNGASEGAYKVETTNLRVNIFNEWGNDIKDIENKVDCNEYVKVNFTITGLNGQTTNKNEDGSDSDSYYAFLGGAIGANPARHDRAAAEAAGDSVVDITGDGDYTATFNLAEGADTIMCLYLETNINVYNRAGFDGSDPASTGINIKINSIITNDGVEAPAETTTTAAPAGNTTSTTTAKPAADGKTTTAKPAGGATTTTAKKEASAATGDMGVGLAVAAFAVAGAAAFVSRKKD